MKNDKIIYDIDQEKLWSRIIRTRKRTKTEILFLMYGVVLMALITIVIFAQREIDLQNSNLSKVLESSVIGSQPLLSSKTFIMAKDSEDYIIKGAKEVQNHIEKNIALYRKPIEDITFGRSNLEHKKNVRNNENSLKVPEKKEENEKPPNTTIELTALPSVYAKSRIISNVMAAPLLINLRVSPYLEEDVTSNKAKKKFKIEVFYGRGLSKYKSKTSLSIEEARFPVGFSYEYGISLYYDIKKNYHVSIGIFQSYPQYVLELNNYVQQRGSRSRVYPYSTNIILKVGKQSFFNSPFYYSFGLMYQRNQNDGQSKILSIPTADFPRIGSKTTVIGDMTNYGLANEIGYNIQLLKHKFSVALNYNSFLRQKVIGEIRNYTDLDSFNVVGDFSGKGNTLSLRFKYSMSF